MGFCGKIIVFATRSPLRLLRTRGLVVKSCAVPVWRFSFVLILGHWPHIGPVPGASLGGLRGPGGFPNGARRFPSDNPRRPKPSPSRASGVLLRAGPPDGGRGPQGDNPGDPKLASYRRGAQVNKKLPKTMSISLRINVHADEAINPYWSKEGAGRTQITTACRKIQTYATTHVVENVHAVEASANHDGTLRCSSWP